MKTFISDIIPKIKKYSKKLDDVTLLTNKHWVVIDDVNSIRTGYIFRENDQLLIIQNELVKKAKWEYLDHNSLLIDTNNKCYMFRHGFLDENILALKVEGIAEYAFLVVESKYEEGLDSFDQIVKFLDKNYIKSITVTEQPKVLAESLNKNFKLPIYDELRISNNKNIRSKYSQITIKFSDNLVGDYFKTSNGEIYYIKVQGDKVYYDDEECTIRGLYYLLKCNRILDIGKC